MKTKEAKVGLSGEQIYRSLRERICAFELLPGEPLSENLLAEQLRVSRAPVRDAMARLAQEGYVLVYPQRGTAVAPIDPERVRQAIFLQVTFERSIVKALSQKGLSPEQLVALEESLERQRQLSEEAPPERMVAEDVALHELLYHFAGREGTGELFRLLEGDQLRVRHLQLKTFSYSRRVQLTAMAGWENCLLEHRMLVDAIRKRDVEAACLMAVNHVNGVLWYADNLQKIYPQYFATHP